MSLINSVIIKPSYNITYFSTVGSNAFTTFTFLIPANTDTINVVYAANDYVVIQNAFYSRINGYYKVSAARPQQLDLIRSTGATYNTPSTQVITAVSQPTTTTSQIEMADPSLYNVGDKIKISGVLNLAGVFIIVSKSVNTVIVNSGTITAPASLPIPTPYITSSTATSATGVITATLQYTDLGRIAFSGLIKVTDSVVAGYNGQYTVTSCTSSSVSYTVTGALAAGGAGNVILAQNTPLVEYPKESAYLKPYSTPRVTPSIGVGGPTKGQAVFTYGLLPFPPFIQGTFVLISRGKPTTFNGTATVVSCTTTSLQVKYGDVNTSPGVGVNLTVPVSITTSNIAPTQIINLVGREQGNSVFGSTGVTVTCDSFYTVADLTAAGIIAGSNATIYDFKDPNYNFTGYVNSVTQVSANVQIFIDAPRNLNYLVYVAEIGHIVSGAVQPSVAAGAFKLGITQQDASSPNKMVIQGANYSLNGGEAMSIKNSGVGTFNGTWVINNNVPQALDVGVTSSNLGVSSIIQNGFSNSSSGTVVQYFETCVQGSDHAFSSSSTNGDSIIKVSNELYIQNGSGAGAIKISNTNNLDILTGLRLGGSLGSSGQYLASAGAAPPTWKSLPSTIVTSVSATFPLASSGGSTPTISISSSIGTGAIVLQTSPTLITPTIGAALGTSLQLSSLTVSSLVTTDSTKNLVSLSGTANQVLTWVSGAPAWQAPATSGTVTSVSMTVPSILTVTGSPITSSGTLAITTTAIPTGSSSVLVLQNSPTLVTPTIGVAIGTSLQLSTLTASSLVTTDISKNLVSLSGTANQILTWVAGAPAWQAPATSGTVTGVLATSPISSTGGVTPTISIPSTTGTGSTVVLATSPTLITPILGAAVGTSLQLSLLTASSLLVTNSTKNLVSLSGTANQVLTWVTGVPTWQAPATSGTVTGVTATTPLSSTGGVTPTISIPSTTGTGSTVVLATSPTLITPTLGAAIGTSLQLSSLTASSLLVTDASKNLVSLSGTLNQVLTWVSGTPTWQAPATSGTVTSVTATAPISSSGGAAPIISIPSTTGTGSTVVLSTSPILITPTLGVASASAINITLNAVSALTVGNTSSSTTATSILLQNATTQGLVLGIAGGTGNYSTSAVLGDAVIRTNGGRLLLGGTGGAVGLFVDSSANTTVSGTLNIATLTASYSVHTDASKNLVSVQNNGTGLNILQTSPTLVTPNIGIATGGAVALSVTGNFLVQNTFTNPSSGSSAWCALRVFNDTGNSLTLALNSSTKTSDGGVNAATIRNDAGPLILANAAAQCNFYLLGSTAALTGNLTVSGTTTLTGNQRNIGAYSQTSGTLFEIDAAGIAGGRFSVSSTGVVNVPGTFQIQGRTQISSPNAGSYYTTSSRTTMPVTTYVVIANWSGIQGAGNYDLTYNSGSAQFVNSTGATLICTCSFYGVCIAGAYSVRIVKNNVTVLGEQKSLQSNNLSITASLILQNGDYIYLQAFNSTGTSTSLEPGATATFAMQKI